MIRVARNPKAIGAIGGFLSLLLFAVCSSSAISQTDGGRVPSGSIYMEAVQAAYLGSGTKGTGTVEFQGNTYRLEIGGLGVGGIGISRIIADGEVYDLSRIEDLQGVYGQVRSGWALGQGGSGEMWLQNDKGVVLHLHAKRQGLMLSLGADGVVIRFAN